MKKIHQIIASIVLSFTASIAIGQIAVTHVDANQAVDYLVGSGVEFSNATFTGDSLQLGYLTGANGTIFPIPSGVVLSSDDVNALELNSFGQILMNPVSGNEDLLTVANSVPPLIGQTFSVGAANDVAILEFDFVPNGDSLSFTYSFGSDEYLEWVNSTYNDVFAFFVAGPGITGPYSSPAGFPDGSINIAVVPESDPELPITISSVNNILNSDYYIDNVGNVDISSDGFTVVLTARLAVICGETYHIKLAIADGSDNALESMVVLSEGSFSSNGNINVAIDNPPTPNWPDNSFAENCVTGAFEIFVNNVDFILADISGTATLGEDYFLDYDLLVGDTIFISSEDSISFFLPIVTLADDLVEGTETITLSFVYLNPCGLPDTATATIDLLDVVPLNLALDPEVCVCPDYPNIATVTSLNGFEPFSYVWSNGSGQQTLAISPQTAQESYSVVVTDYCGMTGEATILVNECHPYTIEVEAENTLPGLQQNAALEGCVDAVFIVNEEVLEDINEFTVIMSGSATEGTDYILTNGTDYTIPQNETEVIIPVEVLEDGQNEGNETIILTINYVNGCGENAVATATMTLVNLSPLALALADQQICENSTITVSGEPNGGQGPFTYDWTNGSDEETITIDAYDTYSVTVLDYCGQTITSEFEVYPFDPLAVELSEDLLDICPVNISETAVATVTGGNSPYSFTWTGSNSSTSSATYDYSDAGSQQVTVEDECGIIVSDELEVTIPSLLVVPTFEEWCINDAYDVFAQGGVSPYFVVIDSVFIAPTGDVFYTATDTGFYSITVLDQCGQVATLNVEGVYCDTVIPNIFTPNSDGANDTFEIFGLAQFPNSEMLIFNRWGNLVFESTNYSNNWNGSDHAEGVYYYIFKRSDGKNFEGYVHLLRD